MFNFDSFQEITTSIRRHPLRTDLTMFGVFWMILQEAILITGLAGYLGLMAGVGMMYLLKDVEADFFRPPEVPLPVILIAIVILVVMGMLAGLWPALRAARIQPIVAMRE